MVSMADSAHGRVLWYELLTTDVKGAERFYTDVVGWTVSPFEGSPDYYGVWSRHDSRKRPSLNAARSRAGPP